MNFSLFIRKVAPPPGTNHALPSPATRSGDQNLLTFLRIMPPPSDSGTLKTGSTPLRAWQARSGRFPPGVTRKNACPGPYHLSTVSCFSPLPFLHEAGPLSHLPSLGKRVGLLVKEGFLEPGWTSLPPTRRLRGIRDFFFSASLAPYLYTTSTLAWALSVPLLHVRRRVFFPSELKDRVSNMISPSRFLFVQWKSRTTSLQEIHHLFPLL